MFFIALLIVAFIFLYPQLAKDTKNPVVFLAFLFIPFLLIVGYFTN